jgi:hypothetical protein
MTDMTDRLHNTVTRVCARNGYLGGMDHIRHMGRRARGLGFSLPTAARSSRPPRNSGSLRIRSSAMANLAERSRAEDRSLLDYYAILRSSLMRLFLAARDAGKTIDAGMIANRLLGVLEARPGAGLVNFASTPTA